MQEPEKGIILRNFRADIISKYTPLLLKWPSYLLFRKVILVVAFRKYNLLFNDVMYNLYDVTYH